MSTPIFEWTFDKNIWPKQSFFGRRWVELWGGQVVTPANGCLYFWGCILSTIAWAARGTFLFPFRKGYHAAEKYVDSLPEPTAKEQAAKVHATAPRWLKALGRAAHWVLATKFSPFRLAAVGIRNTVVAITNSIGGFFNVFGDIVIGVTLVILGIMFVIGAAALLVLFTITLLKVLIYFVIGSAIGLVVMGLFYLIISSGIFELFGMMIMAGKHKVCPAIVIK